MQGNPSVFSYVLCAQENITQLCGRLQHIKWTDGSSGVSLHLTCACSPNHQESKHVQWLMTALRAVRLSDTTTRCAPTNESSTIVQPRLTLKQWRVTPEVVAMLAEVPRWEGGFVFLDCEWEGVTQQVAERAVPASYKVRTRNTPTPLPTPAPPLRWQPPPLPPQLGWQLPPHLG